MSCQHCSNESNITFSVENFNCWGDGKSEVILYSDGRLMTVNNNGVQTLIVTNIKLAQEVEFFCFGKQWADSSIARFRSIWSASL